MASGLVPNTINIFFIGNALIFVCYAVYFVRVDFDPAIGEESLQTIPVPRDVAKFLAEACFCGDAATLFGEITVTVIISLLSPCQE